MTGTMPYGDRDGEKRPVELPKDEAESLGEVRPQGPLRSQMECGLLSQSNQSIKQERKVVRVHLNEYGWHSHRVPSQILRTAELFWALQIQQEDRQPSGGGRLISGLL